MSNIEEQLNEASNALSEKEYEKALFILNPLVEADFPDALVVNKAKHIASVLNVEFDGAYTFDVAAQQIPGTKKP